MADGIVYTDPVSEAHGRAALIERIVQSQARYPGARFENDEFLEHHDQGLFH